MAFVRVAMSVVSPVASRTEPTRGAHFFAPANSTLAIKLSMARHGGRAAAADGEDDGASSRVSGDRGSGGAGRGRGGFWMKGRWVVRGG